MVADHKSQHKLAAILFADIVGYTALMQKGEGNAMSILARYEEVTNQKVEEHKGEVIKTYGDGSLMLFDSTVDAVQCAHDMQLAFQVDPKVPLRIGIHVGEVVRKGNDVFGNGINIASRVESMGVAGSVLISKDAHKRIKNQEGFQTVSLGQFDLKNVEEPIELFSLSNEGLIVPKSEDMRGKATIHTSSGNKKWVLPLILAVLVLAAVGAWQASASGIFSGMSSSPLSEDIRDKRVAVMLFENQTMNSDLDMFGKMISDWVTKGLMETGEANVISAANVLTQVAQAGIVGGGGEFYDATGVGVVIEGRYYLQEDQLMIHANVVDAEKGEVIHALDPIQGPKSKMMDLLNTFTEEILGYWSVRKKTRYLQNPPKYQAYQNMMEVERIFHQEENYERIEGLLTEAFHLDTTFFAPLLKLVVLYRNPGGSSEKADSLIEFIDQRNPTFTKWEKLRYEGIKAGQAGENNWLKAARLNEQLSELDASYISAYYNAANSYVRANHPQRAIDQLNKIDQRLRDKDIEYSQIEARTAEAYYMLGDYEKVVDVAKNYPFPKMMAGIAQLHLRSLIRMDSTTSINKVIDEYDKRGTYTFRGVPRKVDQLLQCICIEAYILDKKDLLNEYVGYLKEYAVANLDSNAYNFNMGLAAYYENNFEKALSFWKLEDRNWARSYLRHASRMGIIYAKLGDPANAEIELAKISNFDNPNIPSDLKLYREAQILTALGKRDEAISALNKAIQSGAVFYPYNNWNNDIFLKPLFDDPEFQEMVRPKG